MIKKIIIEAAQHHDFVLKYNTDQPVQHGDISFLHEPPVYLIQNKGESKRFLAIANCKELASPQEINDIVLQNAPIEFKSDPAFDKNTDLIVLHNLELRASFKKIEASVFEIEENPYYFKKYFLYYSNEESILLKDQNFERLLDVITDERQFSAYREAPLEPTLYSIAARIFIKLPFIKTPVKQNSLKPLSVYIQEAVHEVNLEELYTTITKTKIELTPEQLSEILINEEMENFKA